MEYGFIKTEHKDFPPIVHVETTNKCNIRCIMCPHSDPYKLIENYSPKDMSMNIFRKVVDEIAGNDSTLRLTPDGEPLVHKYFINQIQYAYQKNINILSLNTNGLLLEGKRLDSLLFNCEIKIIIEISLDALYKDTYDSIRCGSNYYRVMRNIFDLLNKRNKNIIVLVSAIKQKEINDEELEQFHKFWSCTDDVIQRFYVDSKCIMPKQLTRNIKERWPCVVPFTRIVVDYNGDIRFCPDDWHKQTVLGNIKNMTIKEAWRSDSMNKLRKTHLNKKFNNRVCKKCTDWKVIKWENNYLNVIEKLRSNK